MRVDFEQEVRAVSVLLKQNGLEVSEPKFYPHYAADYFAIFLSDPDGIQLEICNYRQERRERYETWE